MNEVGTMDMMGQPGDQQNGKTNFTRMAVCLPQTRSAQLVEPIIPFQDSKEALNVTSLAPVMPILSYPRQGHQEFPACLTGIVNHLGRRPENVDDKLKDSIGVIGRVGPHHSDRQRKQAMSQGHQAGCPGAIVGVGWRNQEHDRQQAVTADKHVDLVAKSLAEAPVSASIQQREGVNDG